MKRDMDLARQILFRIEQQQAWGGNINLDFENYSPEFVNYHVLLLHEAGLISAIDASSHSGIHWIPQRLTWEGHEFLDAARDETRWRKVKEIMSGTGGFVLEVAKGLLIDFIKNQIKVL